MAEIAPPISVAIVIFDGVEELDFVGPWEVFSMAKQIGAPLDVFTVGWPEPAIRCAKGLYVVAEHLQPHRPVLGEGGIYLDTVSPDPEGPPLEIPIRAFVEHLHQFLEQVVPLRPHPLVHDQVHPQIVLG